MWHWLGRVPFPDGAALQQNLRVAIREQRAPETLLLLEHDAVITLGKSAHPDNVLQSATALAARGISLCRASRGGDVTFHGPGQLVGYPIVRLRAGVRAHVEGMAAALQEVLATPMGEAKICAFGVSVHHRITMHGFALNLDPDLDAFGLIVPCGLAGCKVTSVRALRGSAPTPSQLSMRVADALGARLGVTFHASRSLPDCNAA